MRIRICTCGWQTGDEKINQALFTFWPCFAYKRFMQNWTDLCSVIAF